MIIALFPNIQKKDSKEIAITIRQFFQQKGITIVAEEEEASIIGATPISKVDKSKIQFLISMGGDGTILRLFHDYQHLNAPILGINLGHLGFMADVPVTDIYPSLQDLLDGKYIVEERLVLQGECDEKQHCFSVNDIVLHRGHNPRLVELAISVNGSYLNTFQADGIIVSTPNGSTAYSLAAGGPILSPPLEAVVITPICPHTISNRPIVLTSSQEIQIKYLSTYDPLEVRSDGFPMHNLLTNQTLRITKSSKKFKLVNLLRRDYFSTLRSKLGWSGKFPYGP